MSIEEKIRRICANFAGRYFVFFEPDPYLDEYYIYLRTHYTKEHVLFEDLQEIADELKDLRHSIEIHPDTDDRLFVVIKVRGDK